MPHHIDKTKPLPHKFTGHAKGNHADHGGDREIEQTKESLEHLALQDGVHVSIRNWAGMVSDGGER